MIIFMHLNVLCDLSVVFRQSRLKLVSSLQKQVARGAVYVHSRDVLLHLIAHVKIRNSFFLIFFIKLPR